MADGTAKFQAVLAGDHDIEKKKRRPLALRVGDDGRSGGKQTHGEAIVFEVMADQTGNVGVVFDDEDGGFHASIVVEEVPGTAR